MNANQNENTTLGKLCVTATATATATSPATTSAVSLPSWCLSGAFRRL